MVDLVNGTIKYCCGFKYQLREDSPEFWVNVEGFEDYAVSSRGRVKRTKPCAGSYVGRILKPKIDKDGYHTLNLSRGGEIKTVKIHRLVAKAYLPAVPGKDQVNHKDGVKSNNAAENLEWADCGDNIRHAVSTGLNPCNNARPQIGERNGGAKLKTGEVWLIKKLLANGVKSSLIRKMFLTTKYSISDIKRGKTWKEVLLA